MKKKCVLREARRACQTESTGHARRAGVCVWAGERGFVVFRVDSGSRVAAEREWRAACGAGDRADVLKMCCAELV